jgi:UDPglucose 6-dehydrogenase
VQQRLHVLREARAAVAAAGVQELVADARIGADAATHLLDVGAELLGQQRHFVHEADARGEHRIGGVLGQLGADIEQVRRGIGTDPRIGHQFLYAGCGYGGSCFPKDVKALLHCAESVGEPMHVLSAVQRANERQKHVLVGKVVDRFGEDLAGRRFALWGLAFKPDTDDLREAPSRVIVAELLARGATLVAHDPVAMDEARRVFADAPGLAFTATPMEALEGADALLIVTEWRHFRAPDLERIKQLLRQPLVIDGRNLFDPVAMRDAGIDYLPIGRAAPAADAAGEALRMAA